MKQFIEAAYRNQVSLLPECLDDFIGEDNNPVRVVDADSEEVRTLWPHPSRLSLRRDGAR
jgi:hypothetical protein